MDFERNYQIKTLSKQLNIKNFSGLSVNSLTNIKAQAILPKLDQKCTYSSKVLHNKPSNVSNSIHPWFITGFTDAEGCFMISILKSSTYRTGWEVQLSFQIKLHKRDLTLLENIQASLGGIGNISTGKDFCAFRIKSLNQIFSLINFFDQYPLITQKKIDYNLFKQVALIMQQKQHLTPEGLLEIVKLKASLNLGLTDTLKLAFPEIRVETPRPLVTDQKIPHSQWIAGFTSGEGYFQVTFSENRYKGLAFKINQHSRDEQLMRSLIEYWGCGYYYSSEVRGDFKVTRFSLITEIIIPFFKENPILGVKALDFQDWCRVAEKVEAGAHKTSEGMVEIRNIKERMNTGRKFT